MDEPDNAQRKQREREFHNREFSDTARGATEKYYAITRQSFGTYQNIVLDQCAGKQMLEYGCGSDGAAFALARHGASVTGIDISDVAIARSQEIACREGLTTTNFRRMDAEHLEFPDERSLINGVSVDQH